MSINAIITLLLLLCIISNHAVISERQRKVQRSYSLIRPGRSSPVLSIAPASRSAASSTRGIPLAQPEPEPQLWHGKLDGSEFQYDEGLLEEEPTFYRRV